jgi:phage-related protein
MVAMADAFLRLRVDSSQVQKDAEAGLDKVDGTSAGKKTGTSFGGGFQTGTSSSLRDAAGKFVSDSDAKKAGSSTGASFGSELRSSITKAFSGFSLSGLIGGGGEGDNAASKTLNSGGILGGLLPGISGLSGVKATIVGIGASAVAALPSIVALQAGFIGISAAISTIALGAKTLIGTKTDMGPLYAQAQTVAATYQTIMTQAATAMLAPLRSVFNQIPTLLKQLEPAIASAFGGAGSLLAPLLSGLTGLAQTVLPQLGGAFRAVGPLLTPLFSGLNGLIGNILPPLIGLIKAAQPAFVALAGILTVLGANLGTMFTVFAPVIASSSQVLTVLGNLLSGLLPIVAKLAASLAATLAPVFGSLVGAVQSLLPFLTQIGGVIASLASAVLTDLGGVFSALASLITDLGPSLSVLGKALSQAFLVLENTGVFAILGDAVERLVPVIAQLINTLVVGLAPAFPAIISAVASLSNILVTLLAAGVTQLLTAITPLIGILAGGAATLITWLNNAGLLVPVLAGLLAVTKGWALAVAAAKAAMVAWGAIMTVVNALMDYETVALKLMYVWDLLVATATKAMAIAQAALDLAMDTGVIGLVVLVIVALAAALLLAWEHSSTFRDVLIDAWHGIEAAWSAAGSFFEAVGAALVTAYHAVTGAWGSAVSFFSGIISGIVGVFTGLADAVTGEFNKIMTFVTSSFDTWWATNGATLEKIWSAVWGAITAVAGAVWSGITAVASAGWAVLVGIFTIEADGIKVIWSGLWTVLSAVGQVAFTLISAYVRTVWGVIAAIFTAEIQIVEAVWQLLWTTLGAVATLAWTLISNAAKVAWAAVQLLFTTTIAIVEGVWSVFWAVLKAAGDVFWAAIEAAVKIAWDLIVGLFTVAIDLLTGNWSGAWKAMQTTFTQIWNAIEAFLKTTLSAIESVISTTWSTVENTSKTIFNALSSFFTTWWNAVKSDFSAAITAVKTVLTAAWTAISTSAQAVFNGLKSALSTIWSGITSVLEAPIKAVVTVVVNPFIRGLDTVLSWVGIKAIPTITGFAAGGMIRNLAAGGRLPGYGGGDRRMIMAEDGETVVSKSTSRAMAPIFGAYGVPGYASGGIVGSIIDSIPGASGIIDATKFISSGVIDALNTISGAASSVAGAVGSSPWAQVVGALVTKTVTSPVAKVEDLVKTKILGPVTSFLSSLLAPSPGSPGAIAKLSGGVAAAQKYAEGLVDSMWPNSQDTNWSALVALWNGESGWNYQADNPTSGAYGIPQALPADKMASAGSDWKTNAATQIRWGLGYIQSVYGSPSQAYSMWESRNPHWYSHGGPVGPKGGSVRRYSNGGPIPEAVFGLGAVSGDPYEFHQGEEVTSAAAAGASNRQLDTLIGAVKDLTAVTAGVPAGVGKHVGGAINGAASDASFAARYPKGGW